MFATPNLKNTSDVGRMEDEALSRRERLKNLKRKAQESREAVETEPVPVRPKFRSYRPTDKALQENVLPEGKVGDVEAEVQQQLEAANARVVLHQLDVTTLAPRKPDWDLKRDIAKKLDKLERRTQRAMAELIRERLKAGQSDLATAVSNESGPTQ